MPEFERAMHTPSKACTRSRVPSMTFTATRSVSPGANSGIGRSAVSLEICSFSRVSMMLMSGTPSTKPKNVDGLARGRPGGVSRPQIGPPLACEFLRLGETPGADLFVMAGHQNVRYGAALPRLGPRVMGV